MKTKYILVSLFNGIGGASIALKDKNVVKTYISEIDKNANKIYDANFKNYIQLGDVTNITSEDIKDIVRYAERHKAKILLVGGSPCQNFSFQGYKNGMTTICNIEITTFEQYINLKKSGFNFKGQSYLFWEFIRVKKMLNPDYFLLENVKMSGKWSDVIDCAMGIQHIPINSALFSPQSRLRFYWTNIEIEDSCLVQTDNRVVSDILDKNAVWQEVTDYLKGNYGKKRRIDAVTHVSKKSHTIPYSIYKVNISSWVKDGDLIHRLTPVECERLQGVPEGYTDCVANSHRLMGLGNGFQCDTLRVIFSSL